jgi:hypothetical protein
MHPRKPKEVRPLFPGDLAEVEQQIKLWSSKAADLGPNIVAFALALSADASHILFKGDLIVFNAPAGRAPDVALPALDLAAIRKIVCNLKILQTEREKLEARRKRHYEATTLAITSAGASRSNEGPSRG